AICESFSNHPVARAVVEHYGAPTSTDAVFSYEETAGMGVKAYHLASELLCGSARLMLENGVDVSQAPPAAVYVAENGVLLGSIEIADALRPDAADAVRELKGAGIKRVSILTGDGEKAARLVAEASGADEFHASLLPAGKVDALMDEKQQHRTVVFVGDGINDAPVLAAADVGIAMGLGSDAAIEAADAVLVSENLRALPAAIRLARRTMHVILFNITFALVVKTAVLVLGVIGLGAMWLAVFADVGVTLLAVLNTTRILHMYRRDVR
ncbi:MAG: HAD-IC family P-type ATPase, partial [Acetanaerobacterium sp.]